MLNRLSISNYALIDNLDISFSKELNILTGETGAGKSIILGALSLILGQRAESKYFFNQQKKCVIEGVFELGEFHLTDFFKDQDLDYDHQTVLRREITADGKSRAFINDTPVNLNTLKQLGEKLIDIHSQHATLEINDEDFQLLVVDTLAGHQKLLENYRHTFKNYREILSKLKELIAKSEQAKTELDYFQFQFDELEKANISEYEQKDLEQELDLLTHAEEIKRNLINANYLLNNHDLAAITQLKEATQNLSQAEKYNPQLSDLVERLNSCIIELKDVASEIESIEQLTHYDESRSAHINERLNILYTLQKKHRVNSNTELLEIRNTLSEKLGEILFSDENIQKLKNESENLHRELISLANELSENRKQVIPKLEKEIKDTLSEIGMPHAVLIIENQIQGDDHLTSTGKDQLRYLFSANKGQQAMPMNKVASGGELSRLMLSIKSLIAQNTALPTIIFDEIDTGISGEVALKVGNIMEKLSENMQVIAITHLPQIASKGKAHYQVYKEEKGDTTQTNITELNANERIIEIAKMLSGETPGEYALQNARELLKH
ncbi:MAG: DNA repair protein RecN [Daejeonella sp.]